MFSTIRAPFSKNCATMALLLLLGCLSACVPATTARSDATATAAANAPRGHLANYDGPDCRVPLHPLPGDGRMDWKFYLSELRDYRACMDAWMDAARLDLALIRARLENAERASREQSERFPAQWP